GAGRGRLAGLGHGPRWPQKGRRRPPRIAPAGRIARELPLAAAHFGLFGAGDRLLFQRADFAPRGPALLAGAPDGPSRAPWSAIAARPFPSLGPASGPAPHMITGGPTPVAGRPRWVPGEAAGSRVEGGREAR